MLPEPNDFDLGGLEPEYHLPYQRFRRNPNPQNNTAMLQIVQPTLDMAVNKYGGNNAGPLLKSRAKQLALQAFGTYDPKRGPLKPHLMSNMRGLQRANAQMQQMLSVPEQVALDRQHLATITTDLEDRLSRLPSTAELADATGLSPKRLKYIRQYVPGFSEGQIGASGLTEDDGEYEPAVTGQDTSRQRAEFLYHDLQPTDQLIMEHLLGLHGAEKLPVGVLARKLNLSPGAISQRATKLQSMVDELEGFGVF